MSRAQTTKILLELLQQRNYKFVDHLEDRNIILSTKPDGKTVVSYFLTETKFKVKGMEEVITIMNEFEVHHAIVICKGIITSKVSKIIKNSKDRHIETFIEEDLQYNITKHRLQPQVRCLDQKEAENFKKEFGTNFGIYKKTDPIVRFYDFRGGDVICITRKSGYVSYRIVSE